MLTDLDTLRLRFEASERESEHGFNLHKCGIGYADEATQARWEAWVACRAAMLQGADGNSPVIPDGWVMVPVHPTMEMLDEFDSIIDYGAEDSKEAWARLMAAATQQEAE